MALEKSSFSRYLPVIFGIEEGDPPEVLFDLLRLSLYGGCPSGGGKKHEMHEPQRAIH
jgi:hypothetical protein